MKRSMLKKAIAVIEKLGFYTLLGITLALAVLIVFAKDSVFRTW